MGIGHQGRTDFKEWEVVFVPVPGPVTSAGGRAVESSAWCAFASW